MVGLSRLERLTSPLSAGCSNHLSYRPRIFWYTYRSGRNPEHYSHFKNDYEYKYSWILFYLPRKEVIQPQVLLQLPCYDFAPITPHTLSIRPPYGLAKIILGTDDFHGVTGGVYKARERIHRIILIYDY